MFRFAEGQYLYLLYLIPVLWIIFYFGNRKIKRFKLALGDFNLIEAQSNHSNRKGIYYRMSILTIAIALIIIGIANPQVGGKQEKIKRSGIDVAIAFDISKSMNAQDLKPSRMERAKQFCSKLMDKLSSDRISFIVFAGNAYTQMPLTVDHSAAKMFLNTINTDLAPTQGTAIGDAINTAKESFNKQTKTSKVILILTDGEDHEGNVYESAESAAKEGISIYTIGIGTPEGGPIPINSNNGMQGFVKDNQGETVVTRLNQEELTKIASSGGGKFFRLGQNNDILDYLTNDLSKLKKGEAETKLYTDYDDLFQYFLFPGLLLLLVDLLWPDYTPEWIIGLKNQFKGGLTQ
jgi:Ca-activated chloride channel family protein